MELKRVVVTGLGAITPVGNSVAQAWENLCNGVSGAGPITHFDASAFKTQFACEVKDFKPEEFGIDRKEGRKMDLYTQYAIAAATQAITDSGMDLETEDKNRIGVVFGVGIGVCTPSKRRLATGLLTVLQWVLSSVHFLFLR